MSETQQPAKAPTEVNKPPPSGSLCPKLVFVVLAVAIGFGCWLEYKVPSIVDPVVFEPGPLPALTGDFKPNARLTQAEKIFEGVVDGPESFAFTKGKHIIHIDLNTCVEFGYVGSANGTLIRFSGDKAFIYGPLTSSCGTFACLI